MDREPHEGPASSFAANISNLLNKLEFRRVTNEAELEAVYRLRYEAYLREDAIKSNVVQKFVDSFDIDSNAFNIAAFLDDRIVAAKRFHLLEGRKNTSPTLEAFPDILRPLLNEGRRIVDPNRFVVDYHTTREFPHLPYAMVRLVMVAAYFFNPDYITIAVRPEHQAFYRRAFFAVPAGEARSYPYLTKQISLMLIDYKKHFNQIIQRGSFYATTESEAEKLFGPASSNFFRKLTTNTSRIRTRGSVALAFAIAPDIVLEESLLAEPQPVADPIVEEAPEESVAEDFASALRKLSANLDQQLISFRGLNEQLAAGNKLIASRLEELDAKISGGR